MLSKCPDIEQNPYGGIYNLRILWSYFINENFHNSRTRHHVDIKLGPVTKYDMRNTTASKKLTITSVPQVVASLAIFQFMANLQPSRSRIPGARSIVLTFSSTITFYLTKNENRTNISLIQLLCYCFEQRYYFYQKTFWFSAKKIA